uniref:Uncharacterized protein n=1 Tax=Rhizochromulina marina TaxID=1034831 RepID=A0A7S2RUA8_9STRA
MRWRMRRRRRQRDQDDEEGGSGCVSWNSLSVCLTAAVLGLGALYVLSPAAVGFQEASSPPSQVTTIVFQAGSDLAAEQRRIRRPFDSVHLTWQPHGDSTDTWILQSGMALSHEAQHVHKPKQIISVFGLEESGSDLVSKTIAHALGMAPFGTWAGNGSLRTSRTVLQHLPLPWGGNCDSDSDVVQTLNVFDSLTMEELIVPPRFFVNITTHVRHLKKREPQARVLAVLVTREATASLILKQVPRTFSTPGTTQGDSFCRSKERAIFENELGRRIMQDSLQLLNFNSEVIEFSYETLLFLKGPYLFSLYQRLGAHSNFVPPLKSNRLTNLYRAEFVRSFTNFTV